MNPPDLDSTLGPRVFTLRIIIGALLSRVAIMAVMAIFFPAKWKPESFAGSWTSKSSFNESAANDCNSAALFIILDAVGSNTGSNQCV